MQNVEITVRVSDSLEEVKKKLISNGFHQTSNEIGEDIYLTNELDKLNKDNILDILNRSILIRHHHGGDGRPERMFVMLKDKNYLNSDVTSEEILSVKIDNKENMLRILEKLGWKELICKRQHFNDFTKDDIVFVVEAVDDIGLLIEFENHTDDLSNLNDEEIIKMKKKMIDIIKGYGINVQSETDVKKAYELIMKKYFS